MSEDKNALDFNSLLAELDETTARLTSPPPSFVIPPTAPASGATATGSTATESNKATANTLGGYGTLRLDKGSASQVPPGTTGANTTTTSATTAAQQLKHGHLSNKSSVSSFKKSVSFDFGLDGAGYIEGEDERPASSSRRSSLGSSSAPSSILKIRVNPMHEVESKTPPLELEDYLLDEDEDFVTGEDDDTTDGYDTEDTEDDEDESTENEDNGVFRKKVVVDEDVESQVDEDLEFGDEDDLPLTVGGSPQSWSLAQFPPTNNPQTAAANTTNSNGDANSDPAMSRLQLSFEEATLEDYEDMDGLLDMLDKYLNRNSKAGHQLGGSPDVRRVVSERKDVGATPLMGLYEVPLATEGSRAEIGSVKLPPPPTSLPPSKVNSNNTQERSVAYPPTATTASPILASPSLKKESKKSSRNPTSTTNNPPTGLGSLPRNFTLPDGSDTDSEEGEVPTAPRSSSSNNKSSPLSGSSQKQQRPAPVPAPRTSSHPKDATNTAPLKTSTPTNSSGPGAPPECGPSLAHHQQQQQQHQQRDSTKQSNDKANQILAKLHAANVKKVTTKLYIQDSRNSFTLSLTSLMTADYVIKALLRMSKLDESPVWTVFEMCNDDGLERPLRSWEIVTDIMSAWDVGTTTNAIVLKKYAYHMTVSPSSLTGKIPQAQGYLYLESDRGKWQKRFCFLKQSDIYYLKDAKKPESKTFFCSLKSYDCFTLSKKRRRKMPTEFAFALRSLNNRSYFQNENEYVHYVCVEKEERLFDWVLALRLARSEATFSEFPELFDDLDVPEKARRRLSASKKKQKTPLSVTGAKSNTLMYKLEQQEASIAASTAEKTRKGSVPSGGQKLVNVERRRSGSPPPERRGGGSRRTSVDGGTSSRDRRPSGDSQSSSSQRRGRHPSDNPDAPHKSGEYLKARQKQSQKKTLIDIKDLRLCQTCGCSDFRGVFAGSREGQCGNCLHHHST